MDLADAAEFDLASTRRNIEGVRPGMQIFEVSSKIGAGMSTVTDFLRTHLANSRHKSVSTSPQQVAPIAQLSLRLD